MELRLEVYVYVRYVCVCVSVCVHVCVYVCRSIYKSCYITFNTEVVSLVPYYILYITYMYIIIILILNALRLYFKARYLLQTNII